MNWVLEQHFSELAAIVGSGQLSQLHRANAHLDGLRIGKDESIRLARKTIEPKSSDCDDFIPAMILSVEMGTKKDIEQALACLSCDDYEIRNAARLGLRLACIAGCMDQLQDLSNGVPSATQLLANDILAFHRQGLDNRLRSFDQLQEIDESFLWFESAGRIPGSINDDLLRDGLHSNSPRVRSSALRAACRSRITSTRELCRQTAKETNSRETIHFLGLLSEESDWKLLGQLLKNSNTTTAALTAIGMSGWPQLIPWLFHFLESDEYAEHAAQAFERITGLTVPRGEPREPPEDLTEDEKDFWVTAGTPKVEIIISWWKENSNLFEEGKRYQEGHNVSDNPLDVISNNLSVVLAQENYLRERLYNPQTPDWELETWPQYWENPNWSVAVGGRA